MASGGIDMSEVEISICLPDLSRMEIYCLACGMGAIVDWEKQHAFPQRCCGCDKEFSETSRNAIVAYQRFYRSGTDAFENKERGIEVKFRIKVL